MRDLISSSKRNTKKRYRLGSFILLFVSAKLDAIVLIFYISLYFLYNTYICSGIGWLVGGFFIGEAFLAVNVTA